jgi:hypothetical protein
MDGEYLDVQKYQVAIDRYRTIAEQLISENGKLRANNEACCGSQHQVLMLQQKFDLLAEVLGVVIVADCTKNPQEPVLVSVADITESAKDLVNYSVVADKLLGLHYRMMREQQSFFKDFKTATRPKAKPLVCSD